jgi:hypothetical protein
MAKAKKKNSIYKINFSKFEEASCKLIRIGRGKDMEICFDQDCISRLQCS